MSKKRRKNGCGTLISKGKGRAWLAKWKFDGKTYYRSTGETVREKAMLKLAEFVKPFQEKTDVEVYNNLAAKAKSADELRTKTIDEHKVLTFDDLTEKFDNDIKLCDIADTTRNNYKWYIKKLTTFIQYKKLNITQMDQIDETVASDFLMWLKDNSCADSYNFILVMMKRLWHMFADEASCKTDVWDKFEKLKVSKTSGRRALTELEIRKLFDCIKDDKDLTLVFAFGIYTGLRLGDCVMMKWSNIDMFNKEVVIVPEKVKRHLSSPLHIPIHNTLYNLLTEKWNDNKRSSEGDEEYVLPDLASSFIAAKSKISRVFKKCGIQTCTHDENGKVKLLTGFHSLRHTFVSMNINNGMNPMLIQKIVGHSTVNMTEHYFHQNMNVIRDGISQMPDLVNEKFKCVQQVEKEVVAIDKALYEKLMMLSDHNDINAVIKQLLDAPRETGINEVMKYTPDCKVA